MLEPRARRTLRDFGHEYQAAAGGFAGAGRARFSDGVDRAGTDQARRRGVDRRAIAWTIRAHRRQRARTELERAASVGDVVARWAAYVRRHSRREAYGESGYSRA